MALNLGNLQLGVIANFSSVQTQIASLRTSLNSLNSSFNANSLINNIGNVGREFQKLGAIITGIFGVGVFTSAKNYMEKEYSMAFVNTIFKDLKKGTQAYRDYSNEITKIAIETAVSTNKIMGATYQAGSSGFDKSQSLTVARLSAMAEISGKTTAETATDTITSIANQYNRKTDFDLTHIADVITMTQDLGKITWGELGNFLGEGSAMWRGAGGSFEDLMSIYAVSSSKGINPQQITTSVKRLSDAIITPLTSEKRRVAESLKDENGTSLADIWNVESFNKDNIGWIEKIIELTKGDSTILGKLFDSSEIPILLNAIKDVKSLQDLKDTKFKMLNENGALNSNFETMNKTMKASVDRLKISFIELSSSIGFYLAPYLEKIVGFLQLLTNKFNSLNEPTKKIIAQFLMTGLAIGVVVFITGTLMTIISSLIRSFMLIKGAIAVFTTFMSTATIPAIVGVIGVMIKWILIISAVIYAIWFLATNWEGCVNLMQTVGARAGQGIVNVINIILRCVKIAIDTLSMLFGRIQNMIPDKLINSLSFLGLGGTAVEGFLKSFATVGKGFDSVSGKIDGAINKTDQWFNSMGEYADTKWDLTTSYSWDYNPFDNMKDGVKQVLDSVNKGLSVEAFKPDLNTSGLIPDVEDLMGNAMQKGAEDIDKYKESIDKLTDGIKTMKTNFREAIGVFDTYSKKIVNGNSLLIRAKNQASAYTELTDIKNSLMSRGGLTDELRDSIGKMTINDLGNLRALNQMDTKSLNEWIGYQSQIESANLQQATGSTYNTQLNVSVQDNNIKVIADAIYKELKKRGAI